MTYVSQQELRECALRMRNLITELSSALADQKRQHIELQLVVGTSKLGWGQGESAAPTWERWLAAAKSEYRRLRPLAKPAVANPLERRVSGYSWRNNEATDMR